MKGKILSRLDFAVLVEKVFWLMRERFCATLKFHVEWDEILGKFFRSESGNLIFQFSHAVVVSGWNKTFNYNEFPLFLLLRGEINLLQSSEIISPCNFLDDDNRIWYLNFSSRHYSNANFKFLEKKSCHWDTIKELFVSHKSKAFSFFNFSDVKTKRDTGNERNMQSKGKWKMFCHFSISLFLRAIDGNEWKNVERFGK